MLNPEDEKKLQEIKVTAQKIYPGRSWEELSQQEQKAVYQNYESMRAQAAQQLKQSQGMAQGRKVGTDGRIFVAASPLEGMAKLGTQYRARKKQQQLDEQEAMGRGAAADLGTRRDAIDTDAADKLRREEEERRRRFMAGLFGNR